MMLFHLGALMLGIVGDSPQPTATPVLNKGITVYAERVYTRPGEMIENGAVHIENGKIRAITPGVKPPKGDDVMRAAAMTAGMVDASIRINTGVTSVEQSKEVGAHRSHSDSIDIFDFRWARQARSGVTTVLANPNDANVIGGMGLVLKTAGEETLEARMVKSDAVVRGCIGTEPSRGNRTAFGPPTDFYVRRPTTRMGVEGELRKAFWDAAQGVKFDGHEELLRVLKGELPLCIQAATTQDIRTAIFLEEEMKKEGFGDIRLIVDACAEAWMEPDFLVRTGTAAVLPPFDHDGRTPIDGAFMAWNVAKLLQDKGVMIALSSHGAVSAADRLGLQASYAMRGGLTFDEALAAVTSNPAEILGVQKRVGSIATGMDGDVVLWSGTPFEPSSRIVGVLIDGEPVDAR